MIVEQFVDSEISKSGDSSEMVSDSRKTSVEIGQKEQRSPSHQNPGHQKQYLNVSPVKLQDSSSYRMMANIQPGMILKIQF